MHFSVIAFVPLLATALAQTLMFFDDDKCEGLIDPERMYSILCGYDCTNLDPDKDKSVMSGALEPNQQVVLYTEADCKGDAYAAIGDAYGSTIADNTCGGRCDGFSSFKVQVYNNEGGGDACPPGSLSEAPTQYPKPTETC